MSYMKLLPPQCLGGVALLALILTTVASGDAAPPARTTLYWCLDRLGSERILVNPRPGCEPLINDEDKEKVRKNEEKTGPVFTIDAIENSVSAFMQRYRHFLACCTSDPSAIKKIDDLEEEALTLVEFSVTSFGQRLGLFFRSNAGGLIVPVAQARVQLRKLRIQLESLVRSRDNLHTLSYESAGHERRRIQEVEESIPKDFSPPTQFERAPTGPEIGAYETTGALIGQSARTGTSIGFVPPTDLEIGTTPPSASEIGFTPPSAEKIGTTPLTGPAISNSSFNRRP